MTYAVAVRSLCEFSAKRGDLDLRFTPSPTSQEGIAGHGTVTARRSADYQREVSLHGEYQALAVRGRADGFDPNRRTLEEIKTYRGALAAIPDNHRCLHRAQANTYGWLLCSEQGLPGLNISVVYFDVDSEKETPFTEYVDAAQLRQNFEALCECFLAWARQEMAHRSARDAAIALLKFPLGQFRTGQRDLAESVYKACHLGRALLAQAPTGTGKTLGTLFPALKAMAAKQLDKVLFLTAKTTGRALGLEALKLLRGADTTYPLRYLELTARDKSCEHPDKACHGESCPLAKGFYDRLPAARAAAAQRGELDQATLKGIAATHAVCPYYLSQEMARWSDVIVGDFNYYFDVTALLHGLAQADAWQPILLVDEAHSLVDRARAMYSAELSQRTLRSVRQNVPAALKKPLDRLHRQWQVINATAAADYTARDELPITFVNALHKSIVAIGDYQVDHAHDMSSALLEFYFDALHFFRLAESFGTHSQFDIECERTDRRVQSVLRLRNVVPAPYLQPRFKNAHAAILFSGTLSPGAYYRSLLGLPEDVACIDVASPFRPEQLDVYVTPISTRFRDRVASLQPIVDLMAQQWRRRPGNYLAFFNSFDYLEKVLRLFGEQVSEVPTWTQHRSMCESDRTDFLDRFRHDGQGIGFAVLGGAFGEGIDLPGDRLIGAFVATLGLPQVNPVNEQMMRRMAKLFGESQAYDYSYLIPGIRKVSQAAGRIIRTLDDTGILYLIDDRFAQRRVRQLLPAWWKIKSPALASGWPDVPTARQLQPNATAL